MSRRLPGALPRAGDWGGVRTDLTSPTLAARARLSVLSVPELTRSCPGAVSEVGMSQTNAAARTGAPPQPGRLARLRMSSFGLVMMLILEFVLGIIYNLYGTAPTAHKSVGLFSSPDLALHVILGILLVVAAVMQL